MDSDSNGHGDSSPPSAPNERYILSMKTTSSGEGSISRRYVLE
jgi:hypothetical protein